MCVARDAITVIRSTQNGPILHNRRCDRCRGTIVIPEGRVLIVLPVILHGRGVSAISSHGTRSEGHQQHHLRPRCAGVRFRSPYHQPEPRPEPTAQGPAVQGLAAADQEPASQRPAQGLVFRCWTWWSLEAMQMCNTSTSVRPYNKQRYAENGGRKTE